MNGKDLWKEEGGSPNRNQRCQEEIKPDFKDTLAWEQNVEFYQLALTSKQFLKYLDGDELVKGEGTWKGEKCNLLCRNIQI